MPAIDIRIGASFITSKVEQDFDPEGWKEKAERHLMEEVSFLLSREHSETIERDGVAIEKRIDLYVASPHVFWRMVKEEAEKIAFMHYAKK